MHIANVIWARVSVETSNPGYRLKHCAEERRKFEDDG
jgi:hypothetical protein